MSKEKRKGEHYKMNTMKNNCGMEKRLFFYEFRNYYVIYVSFWWTFVSIHRNISSKKGFVRNLPNISVWISYKFLCIFLYLYLISDKWGLALNVESAANENWYVYFELNFGVPGCVYCFWEDLQILIWPPQLYVVYKHCFENIV